MRSALPALLVIACSAPAAPTSSPGPIVAKRTREIPMSEPAERAPYGHAGQWPSLAVLATPPDKRPSRFLVDLDAPYDLQAVGVATRAPGGPLASGAYVHDAALPGFSVAGHPYLADLGADAAAVIEYLKTSSFRSRSCRS